MTKKQISNISDKLVKISESFTINMYDNGFMIEAGGRDDNNDYVSAKIMCSNVEQLLALVTEACSMSRDS